MKKIILIMSLFSAGFYITACKSTAQSAQGSSKNQKPVCEYKPDDTQAIKAIQEQLKDSQWTLTNLEQKGTALPIALDYTTLTFNSDNTFVANFCHKIKGKYSLSSYQIIQLSDLAQGDVDDCAPNSFSPMGTRLPNIPIAESILLDKSLKIEINKNYLFLSNEKGRLTFSLLKD